MIPLRWLADEEIVLRIRRGRKDAFAVLVERYLSPVRGMALARTGNPSDAEDVAQETFLKAYLALDQLRDPARFGPWLIAIAKNVCGSVRARSRRDERVAAVVPAEESVAPPDLERQELWTMVSDILHQLDESTRDILVLTYFSGKNSKEVAELLGITPEAARKRLQRARESLGDKVIAELQREANARRDVQSQSARIMGLIAGASAPWSPLPPATLASTLHGVWHAAPLKYMAGVLTAGLVVAATGLTLLHNTRTAPVEAKPAAESATRLGMSESPAATTAKSRETALSNLIAHADDKPTEAAPALEKTSGPRPPVLPNPGWSGSASITGVLVYLDGRPGAGVKVGLIRGRRSPYYDKTFAPPYEGDPLDGVWKTVQADARGRFTFSNLPMVDYCLVAQAPDGLCVRSVYSSRMETESRLDKYIAMGMDPAAPLNGVVVGPTGEPIPNAKVYPYVSETQRGGLKPLGVAWQKALAATTDAQGRFSFTGLWKPRWRLRVWALGYGALTTDFVSVGGDPVQIVLPKGKTVTGHLRRADTREPVAGASVVFVEPGVHPEPLRVITDAEGGFRIAGLPEEPWLVALEDADLALQDGPVSVTPSQPETKIELIAARGGVLHGVVRGPDGQEPQAGYQVVAWSGPDRWGYAVPYYSPTTDNSGAFTVTGVPGGAYRLELYRGGKSLRPVEKLDSVSVTAGKTLDGLVLTVPSDPSLRVAGTVVDSSGRPVVGAAVTGEDQGQTVALAFSDNRGRFELDGFTPSSTASVWARKGEHLAATKVAAPCATDTLVLTMQRAAGLEGSLTDTEGKPLLSGLKKAIVTAVPVTPEDAATVTALTSNGGWYRMAGLVPGTYDLWIQAEQPDDLYPPRTRIRQVVVEAGQLISPCDLVYGRPANELTISGRILTSTGEPVPDAWVDAVGSMRGGAPADADGRYVVQGLQPGVYQVTARSVNAGLAREADVQAGQKNLDLVLGGLGAIEGRVVDPSGRPVKDYTLSARPTGSTVYGMMPQMTMSAVASSVSVHDDSGWFRLDSVFAGAELRVNASTEGYLVRSEVVEPLVANEVRQVTIQLEEGGAIRGRLRVNGEALAGARVYVGGEGLHVQGTPTSLDGSFTVTNVPPGENTLSFHFGQQGQGWRHVVRPVNVEPGQILEVDVSVPAADGSLAGVVTCDGVTPARAQLFLKMPGTDGLLEQMSIDVNSDGTYFTRNVPVGEGRLEVVAVSESGQEHIDSADVSVSSGAPTRQDFAF